MAQVNRRIFSKNKELATKAYADSAFTAARSYTDTKKTEAINAAEAYTDNELTNYLAKDNSAEYYPSSTFNPATVGYVDDALNELWNAPIMKAMSEMPSPSDEWGGQIVYYSGNNYDYFIAGHVYECVYDDVVGDYIWVDKDKVSSGEIPNATQESEGTIIQYTGDTDENFVQGYFYKCIYDNTEGYIWQQIDVQPATRLSYISNAEIDAMFAEPVEGPDLTLGYGTAYMDEAQNPIAILNNEILLDENSWQQDGDPEEHGWVYYVPNSEDIMKITFSYEDLEIVAPYDGTEIDQYYEDNKWNYVFYFGNTADYLADIFARTNGTLNGVTVNIRIQPGVLTIDGELNEQINKTFVYGQPVEGNSYPILTIDKSELTYITSEGEGQDQVDIYKIPETSEGYVNYYYIDKPNGDVAFYDSAPMFPLHVIDEGITYSIEAEWNPENDTGHGHGNYVVEAHRDLPEYLNDWVEWGTMADPETGDNMMIAVFGKSWDRS